MIERDEEWHPGFVLKRDGDRYFVHYVGGEMSENEWVSVEPGPVRGILEDILRLALGLDRTRPAVSEPVPGAPTRRNRNPWIRKSSRNPGGPAPDQTRQRRSGRWEATHLRTDIVAGSDTGRWPGESDSGTASDSLLDELAKHRHEKGMSADAPASDHPHTEFDTEVASLLVQVVEDLHVIGEESDRDGSAHPGHPIDVSPLR